MNTIPFSEIRESFTEIAHRVQFLKEPCVLTRNNKPAAGLVPIEYLMLLNEILEKSKHSKELADITNKYVLVLEPHEFKRIQEVIANPPEPTARFKAGIRAAQRKFED